MGAEFTRMMQGCLPGINPDRYSGLETPATALQDLTQGVELMKMQQETQEKNSIQAKIRALQLKKHGNKPAAITAMKESKQYSAIAVRVSNQKMVLEQVKATIETASVSQDIAEVLGRCTVTIKGMADGLDVNSIDNLMDQLSRQNDDIQEISETMSKPMDSGDALHLDEDDLWAELEDLESNPTDELCFTGAEPTHKDEDGDTAELLRTAPVVPHTTEDVPVWPPRGRGVPSRGSPLRRSNVTSFHSVPVTPQRQTKTAGLPVRPKSDRERRRPTLKLAQPPPTYQDLELS